MLAKAKSILPSARLLGNDMLKIVDEIRELKTDVRFSTCDLKQPMELAVKRNGVFLIENKHAEDKRDVEKLAEILGRAKRSPGNYGFCRVSEVCGQGFSHPL
jgi:hypothetical protein